MNTYKIGDKVYHPCDFAPFIVVGLREKEIEIKGDWSGGTHNINESGWVSIDEVEPYDPNKPVYYFNGKPYKRIEYVMRLKTALSICHDLLRDIDIYTDQPEQTGWGVKNCSKIATEGLNNLYKDYPDLFFISTQPENLNKRV